MRPLFDEDGSEPASEVSRDYVFELEHESGAAPLLNVFGGKITTYRRLPTLSSRVSSPLTEVVSVFGEAGDKTWGRVNADIRQ